MSEKIINVSLEDYECLSQIFNYYIQNSFAAFPSKPLPQEMFSRIIQMIGDFPVVKSVNSQGAVQGFGFFKPFHLADTFSKTVELTYFLAPEWRRQGIGSRILNYLEKEARKRGIEQFLACISSKNEESLIFHLKHGFSECGRFLKAGKKKGVYFDLVWMQKEINPQGQE